MTSFSLNPSKGSRMLCSNVLIKRQDTTSALMGGHRHFSLQGGNNSLHCCLSSQQATAGGLLKQCYFYSQKRCNRLYGVAVVRVTLEVTTPLICILQFYLSVPTKDSQTVCVLLVLCRRPVQYEVTAVGRRIMNTVQIVL